MVFFFFATGITEKQLREQIPTPQYLAFLYNHWTNPVNFPYQHSNQRKYEYKVIAEVLLFCSQKFLNNKSENYSKSFRIIDEIEIHFMLTSIKIVWSFLVVGHVPYFSSHHDNWQWYIQ